MRKSVAAVLAALALLPGLANASPGFSLGGGVFDADNADCVDIACGYSGAYLELGYDINHVVGIEFKHASGDGEYGTQKGEFKTSFFGVNVGGDFGTQWFRLYGKIGLARVKEEWSDGAWGYSDFSETGLALGLGARFILTGRSTGPYAKLEVLSVSFQDDSVGAALLGGVGLKF